MEKPHAEYKGVKIFLLTSTIHQLDATVSYDNKRIVFHGQIAIERTNGSYRYGDQVLIALWMKEKPKFEDRCSQKGYNRIEINLSIDDAIRMFREALEKLEKRKLVDFL